MNLEPKTIKGTWCDPRCPHFRPPTDQVKLDGYCKLLNVELDYYDWFLAACEYGRVDLEAQAE